jgi:hypothetical protein
MWVGSNTTAGGWNHVHTLSTASGNTYHAWSSTASFYNNWAIAPEKPSKLNDYHIFIDYSPGYPPESNPYEELDLADSFI